MFINEISGFFELIKIIKKAVHGYSFFLIKEKIYIIGQVIPENIRWHCSPSSVMSNHPVYIPHTVSKGFIEFSEKTAAENVLG